MGLSEKLGEKPKIHWFIMVHHHFVWLKLPSPGIPHFQTISFGSFRFIHCQRFFFRFLQPCKSLRDGGEDNLTDVRGFTVAHLAASMYGSAIPKCRSNKRLLYLLVPAIHFKIAWIEIAELNFPMPHCAVAWDSLPCCCCLLPAVLWKVWSLRLSAVGCLHLRPES